MFYGRLRLHSQDRKSVFLTEERWESINFHVYKNQVGLRKPLDSTSLVPSQLLSEGKN